MILLRCFNTLGQPTILATAHNGCCRHEDCEEPALHEYLHGSHATPTDGGYVDELHALIHEFLSELGDHLVSDLLDWRTD